MKLILHFTSAIKCPYDNWVTFSFLFFKFSPEDFFNLFFLRDREKRKEMLKKHQQIASHRHPDQGWNLHPII